MVRSWIKLTDRNNKPHIINAETIIDINDVKDFGYYTIKLRDSTFVDITQETFIYLIGIFKPIDIDVVLAGESKDINTLNKIKKDLMDRLAQLDELLES